MNTFDLARQIQETYTSTLDAMVDEDSRHLFQFDMDARRAYKEKRLARLHEQYSDEILLRLCSSDRQAVSLTGS
jgi:hypothetical protein